MAVSLGENAPATLGSLPALEELVDWYASSALVLASQAPRAPARESESYAWQRCVNAPPRRASGSEIRHGA